MFKSSGSQFLSTITEIPSALDALEEHKAEMTLLNILG